MPFTSVAAVTCLTELDKDTDLTKNIDIVTIQAVGLHFHNNLISQLDTYYYRFIVD